MPSRITPTIPYADGFSVKPLSISAIGIVTFTDNGTNEFRPNQTQCEKYGYKFDIQTSTCFAYKQTSKINTLGNSITNTVKGQRNNIASATNCLVTGQGNQANANVTNAIMTGNNNQMKANNSIVLGSQGIVSQDNSLVIGGNLSPDAVATNQFVRCLYSVQTTSNSTEASALNGVTGERFVIPDNSIIYFHADTLVVRVGGTSGSGATGDYGSYVERGVIINKVGSAAIQRERDTIKTSGTVTNWRILASVGADNTLSLTCRGQTNMTLEWAMNVNITLIKTGVTL